MSVMELARSPLTRSSRRVLILLALLHVFLFVASLVVMPVLAPGAKIPNPFVQDGAARDLYTNFGLAVRVSSFLQLVSAVCLAALGAVWNVPGDRQNSFHSQALIWFGSLGSAILLSISALASWALAAPGSTDPGPALHTLQFTPFLMGGPGWSAFFGLFLIGICWAGATVLPRWLIWSGTVLAVIAELATLTLVTITASVGLPISRFLGFVWILIAAVMWSRESRRPD